MLDLGNGVVFFVVRSNMSFPLTPYIAVRFQPSACYCECKYVANKGVVEKGGYFNYLPYSQDSEARVEGRFSQTNKPRAVSQSKTRPKDTDYLSR